MLFGFRIIACLSAAIVSSSRFKEITLSFTFLSYSGWKYRNLFTTNRNAYLDYTQLHEFFKHYYWFDQKPTNKAKLVSQAKMIRKKFEKTFRIHFALANLLLYCHAEYEEIYQEFRLAKSLPYTPNEDAKLNYTLITFYCSYRKLDFLATHLKSISRDQISEYRTKETRSPLPKNQISLDQFIEELKQNQLLPADFLIK